MFGFYRVATCSPVVKVADAEFNTARILELAEKAAAHSASVVLFPELAVTAYSCGDLFHNETLLNAAEHAVSRIAEKAHRFRPFSSSALLSGGRTACSTRRS